MKALQVVLAVLSPEIRDDLIRRAANGMLRASEAQQLQAMCRDAELRPLAWARLWHAEGVDNSGPKPRVRTSQRECMQAINAPGTVALALFGGTGSGKTEAGAQFAVASALGRQDPTAREWCRANGIDLAVLPPGPGRILASSQTHDESRRVVRVKLKKYLPAGCVWRNEFGPGTAEVTLPTGGVIVCKSNEETYKGYEADEFDNGWLDEEHDQEVHGATMGRLGRRGWSDGHVLNTMTPLKGKSWVYYGFVEPLEDEEIPAGRAARFLHGVDNPFLDQELRRTLFAGLGAAERAAREYGEFVSRDGRIYEFWDRAIHLWDGAPDPTWTRFDAFDWGTTNPTAMGFFAYDAPRDDLYLVDEVYLRNLTIDQRADHIKTKNKQWGQARWRVGDPGDAATMESLRAKGIAIDDAVKDVKGGITVVNTRMAPDVNGKIHFRVHVRCVRSAGEVDGYVWDNALKETPKKVNDHACDMIRYGCVSVNTRHNIRQAAATRVANTSQALDQMQRLLGTQRRRR